MKQTEISKSRGWWKHLLLLGVTLLGAIGFATAAPTYPFPNNYAYPYGSIYTGSEVQNKIQSLYEAWKKNYYTTSGSLGRVKFVQSGEDGTNSVSEGIAYGMLIFVYMDNATNNTQLDFDRLWAYYKLNMNDHGVMNWKVNAFTGSVTAGNGNANGATDADLDAAQALLMAYKQWGDSKYLTDAKKLIKNIWMYEVNSKKNLKPGDYFDDYKNPCYFITNAMKLFDQVNTLESWGESWDFTTVANNCYSIMEKSANSSTGLIPDWCYEDGSYLTGIIDSKFESIFGYDAVRIPWRMAHAYAWYGDGRAKDIASKITAWAQKTYSNPANIVDGYFLDGRPGDGTGAFKGSLSSWGSSKNACFKAGLSIGSMVDATYKSYMNACWSNGSATDVYGAYYTHTTQLLFMLCLTGNMPNFYDMLPVCLSAETDATGSAVILNFSKPINASSATSSIGKFVVTTYPTADDATNKTNGTTISVSSASVSSKAVTLNLSSDIADPYIYVSYSGTTLAGTDGSKASTFADKQVTNKVTSMEPYPVARYTDVIGTKVYVQWSKDVKLASASASDFTVYVNGAAVSGSPTLSYFTDEDGIQDKTILALTFLESILASSSDAITLSYVGGLTSLTGTKKAKAFTKAVVQNFYMSESCLEMYATGATETGTWDCRVDNIPMETDFDEATGGKAMYLKSTGDYQRLIYTPNSATKTEWNTNLADPNSRLTGKFYLKSLGTGADGLAIFLMTEDLNNPDYNPKNAAFLLEDITVGSWYEFDIPLSTTAAWSWQAYSENNKYNKIWIAPFTASTTSEQADIAFELYIDEFALCPKKQVVTAESGKVAFDGSQVELHFSTAMKIPASLSAITIKEGSTTHAVSSIETKTGDASTLIFNLESPITSSSVAITASLAAATADVKSNDGRKSEPFSITLANLIGCTTSTGWYDDFADANDYVTANLNVGTFDDDVNYSIIENAKNSTLDFTQDGSESWGSQIILAPYSEATSEGFVLDLSGDRGVIKFNVKSTTRAKILYRIDVKDYFGNKKDGTFTDLTVPPSGVEVTYNPSFSGVDPTAISEIQFRFIKSEGTEANDYVPTLYDGTLSFDYISVGQPLYLSDFSPAAVLDTKAGIDENSSFTVKSSSDGYIFVVRGDVNPQYSAMMAAVNAGEGTYTACTANTTATIDMTGLGYGYFKAYAYDPVSGSVSSAYGCQVKDVTPPHFTEYFNESYIDADGTLFFTVDEDATVYLMPCDVEKTEISNTIWQWIVEGGKPTVYDMTTMYEGKLIKPGNKFYLVAADGSGNYSDVVPESCFEINQVALDFSVDAAEYTIGETIIVEASRPSTVYLIPSTESIRKIGQLDTKKVLSAETNQYGLGQILTDELIIEDTTTYYIYVADLEAGEFVGPSSLITIVPATYTLNKITLDQEGVVVSAGCEPAKVQVTFDEARYPNQKLTFSGDYADYVTITYDETANAQGKGTILLEGLKAGEPTITVTCDADETKTATFTAQVVVVPTDITVDGITDDKLTLSVGETKTLSAAILPASSAQDVLWSTSNKSVVDVTGTTTGAIKAVAKGTATLTVKSKGTGCDGYVTKDITVTVKEAGLTSIAVWGGDGVLCKDDAVSEYTIDFESEDWNWIDPEDEDANYTTFAVSYSPTSFTSFSGVTVSSSNTSVATVTTPTMQKGFKTFGCGGSADAYVFDVNFLDLDGDCAITVTAKDDPSITATIIIGNPPCDAPKPTNAKATPASPTPCDEVTLSATGTGTLTWYEGTTKLSSANLGTLTAGAHTYYVSNTTSTCESEKVQVNVTVTAIAAPTSTEAPAITATTDDEVVLKATLSSGTAAWYTTATGGTALTSTNVGTLTAGTHTYYVARVVSGCESERTAVVVTVSQAACKTAAPTATEVPDATFCEGTTATLAATFSGTATAVWYEAATGGSSVFEGNSFATGKTAVGPYTYYVAKKDGCESEARTEVSLTITAKPTAEISSTVGSEYCATVESVALAAVPNTGSWSGTGVSGTTFSPKTAGAGKATVTYTIGTTGCQNTYTKDITVTAAPTVTVTVPEKMCSGDAAATLSAMPSTGTWSGTGVTGTSFDPSKGTSVVKYTYSEGACEVVKESTITVGTTPSPKISGLDASYCSNAAAVTMTAAPTGGSFKVNGSAATTFNPAAATVGANTVTYTVTVDGCEGTVDAPVTVVAAPSIDLSGVATTACAGQEVTLAPTTGKWTGTGVTGTTFVSSTADTYELTYTEEANGCSASDNVSITVTKATTPTVTPGIVEIGSDATPLTATGSGTINWYETQTGASIATGASYTPTVSTAAKATFTFYVSNTDGSCESEKVPVTFTVTDCMTPAPIIADYTELCEGETATLSATGSNIKWYNVAEDGEAIEEGATLDVTTAGTYYASQDATGCESARASVVVTFKSKPAVPTATGASSCAGAELVAMTTIESANWYASQTGAALATAAKEYKPASISETTTFYVNQTVSGCTSEFVEVIYTVKATPDAPSVTPTKACLGTDADYVVTATGTGLQWYDSNNSPLGTASNQTVSGVTTAKDYTYSVTQTVDGCESAAATATLTVNALPTPSITLDAEYCDASETEVMLSATPNGGDFTINGDAATSFVPKTLGDGEYTVTYSYTDEETGCTGKAADVTFIVKDCSDPAVTSITLNKSTLTLTEGDTYNSFIVTILPTEGIYNKTYAWKSSDETVATVNATTGEITAVKAGSAVITVYSTYTEGKEATCNVTVEEKIIPVEGVSFAAGVPTTVDEYGNVDLSSFVTINPAEASHPEIKWTVSGTAATIEDGVLTAGKVSADTKVTVTVEVTAGGVTKKATTQITIIRGPVAVESITVTAPMSVQENGSFTAKATVSPSDANDKTFTWSIDGSGASINTSGLVTVTGVSGTTFDVVATANDGSGVVGKATVNIVDQIFPVESVTFMDGIDYEIFASGSMDLSDYIVITPSNASVQGVEWSLTSTSYATIDATTGVISGKTVTSDKTATAQATVTYLKADGNTATTKGTVKVTIKRDPIMVSAIKIENALELEEEATYTMKAVVTPTNADDKTVTWSVVGDGGSIDPTTGVLTITGSEGDEFVVIATANDEDAVESNECKITVLQKQIPVTAINVSVSSVEVTAGMDEATIEISYEPSNTTQKDFVLIAGSTNFSYVDNEDGTITITGNQGGTGTLTIKSVSNPSVMQAVEVKVTELVKNITVSGKATLNVGNTTQMTANVGESTATNKTVTWSSTDESIATVSATGLVTAKSAGMVQIVATSTDGSNISGYTYVTINTIPVEKITVSGVTLEIGQTGQIKATVYPSNATYKDLIFEVADNSIISVDGSGFITTYEIGSTEVTVSAPNDNVSQKIVVEVTPIKADKEYLIRLIEDEVWGAYSVFYKVESGEYKVGLSKGQISPLVYNEFQEAWMAAQDVRYETYATQEQVDEAANRLYKAIVAMGADPDPDPSAVEDIQVEAKVYPTIVTNAVTIEANNLKSVKIVSMSGKVVAEEQVEADEVTIEAGNFSQGFYKVIVDTEDGQAVHSFIKK